MNPRETHKAEGARMDDAMGPLSIKRTWSAMDGRYSYRIAWTAEQLRRIGQAIEQGEEAYLERVEQAIRLALNLGLTSQIAGASAFNAGVLAPFEDVRPSDFQWHQDDRS
ncbi:MAG TPA: hypothetical protein VNP04_23675 [Alphaproteobacteria bacterium]|nr:hypothetical protein [Alphaproteobacteria bacterium]